MEEVKALVDRAPTMDVDTVLAEQSPWHRGGQVPTLLAPPHERPLARFLWRRLDADGPRRFLVVLGARRVGKTTTMYQAVRHLLNQGVDPGRLWWMRLDHPVLLRSSLGDLVRRAIRRTEATADDPVYLFLDELVYALDWDLWLKTFYDEHWPVRIVATSSATAALRDRRLESGVGRWLELYLPPYSFSEYLDLVGRQVPIPVAGTLAATLLGLPPRLPEAGVTAEFRRRYLLVGGYPELLVVEGDHADDNAARVLRSQQILRADAVERAVYKDIPQSFGVDNPMALERLLYVVAAQVCGIFSPSGAAAELGLSQPTLDKYLGYLRRAFLLLAIPNYSGSEESVQRRGRKVYFVDGAARNAALQRGLAPLDDPAEMGVLLENAAAAALHALCEQTGGRLYHWRDGRDEVDLVLDAPLQPLAFEIGSSTRHHRAGLIKLMRKYPKFRGGCYLVTPDSPRVHPDEGPDGVGSLPWDMFVLACGRQAARELEDRMTEPKDSS